MPGALRCLDSTIVVVIVAMPAPLLALRFCPEAVTRALNKYVFKTRLGDRNTLHKSRKRLDHLGHKTMALFALQAHRGAQHRRVHQEALAHARSQLRSPCRGRSLKRDHVAADFAL